MVIPILFKQVVFIHMLCSVNKILYLVLAIIKHSSGFRTLNFESFRGSAPDLVVEGGEGELTVSL